MTDLAAATETEDTKSAPDRPGLAKTKSTEKLGPQKLKVRDIKGDGSTQTRAKTQPNVIRDYVADMREGSIFPPPVVFFDGTKHWLADGFQRVEAHIQLHPAAASEILCEVRKGDKRDAILFGVGANESDKARRTTADKRRAVTMILADPEWLQKSNVWIAEQCKVSDTFVAKLRPILTPTDDQPAKREGKDGRSRKPPNAKAPKVTKKPDDPKTTAKNDSQSKPANPSLAPAAKEDPQQRQADSSVPVVTRAPAALPDSIKTIDEPTPVSNIALTVARDSLHGDLEQLMAKWPKGIGVRFLDAVAEWMNNAKRGEE